MQSFKENYDIVVIGAGLAGLSCAYSASRKGVKVLVLEKNSEFGIKPCGEGIPIQIQKDFDVTPFIKNKIKGYYIYYKGKVIIHQRFDEPLGYIIDNITFESFFFILILDFGRFLTNLESPFETTMESWFISMFSPSGTSMIFLLSNSIVINITHQ